MFTASKHSEIHAPYAADFCDITDNTYSCIQMYEFERQLLATLDFDLTIPTAHSFLDRVC